jgi:hypothetical protein
VPCLAAPELDKGEFQGEAHRACSGRPSLCWGAVSSGQTLLLLAFELLTSAEPSPAQMPQPYKDVRCSRWCVGLYRGSLYCLLGPDTVSKRWIGERYIDTEVISFTVGLRKHIAAILICKIKRPSTTVNIAIVPHPVEQNTSE